MTTKDQTVYIIGAGAIGKSLAAFLNLSGRRVVLVRGSVDGQPDLQTLIRIITKDNTVHEAMVETRTISSIYKFDGIVILANKSYGNNKLASSLKDRIGDSPIVLLQNGLGVERPFMNDSFADVYRCVLFLTSQPINITDIRFKAVTACPIGIEKGSPEMLQKIVEALDTPRFTFRAELDIQPIIWTKAIANCAFNSICPLLEADNGIFRNNTMAFSIAKKVSAECTSIANAMGVSIDVKNVDQKILEISEGSDGQLISTLQDINSKRQTEIDTLNFEIVRMAELLGRADDVPITKLLGQLISIKSQLTMGSIAD